MVELLYRSSKCVEHINGIRGAAIALVKECFAVRASIEKSGWLTGFRNQDEGETGFGSDDADMRGFFRDI